MKTRLSLAALAATFSIASLFAADSASTTPAPAQSTPSVSTPLDSPRPGLRRPMQHRRAERAKLAERLELTDAQKDQLKARRAESAAAAKAIRNDTSLTPEQKQARLRETRQAAQAEMRALLTPEQQAQLDGMKKRGHRAVHRRTSL